MHDRHVRKRSCDSVLHTFVLKISHANIDQTQGDYKNCCRGQLLAIGLPRNRMTFLRRDNIRGSTDRSRAAADIGSQCQRPRQRRQGNPLRLRQGANDRYHGCRERNIIDKRARERRNDQNNADRYIDIALADLRDQLRDHTEHAGLLQSANHHEQTHKERS